MPGASAEQQHLLCGSLFSEHSPSSPCAPPREEMQNPSSPQKPLSSDETELRARPLMDGSNFFSDEKPDDLPVRRTLAQNISFGSSGYGFPYPDDFPGLLFCDGFQKDDHGSIPVPAAFPTSNNNNNAAGVESPDAIAALQKFLPSNNEDETSWPAVDAYSCDEFRMYEFKVRRCMRGRSHDWTECPFAHPGEKARRRDPRRFHYSGTGCPDFRKGSCRRGDACEFAHGVFECWLHPARYRTQPCKDGRNCRRRVCFFAHTPEQLRLLPGSPQVVNSRNSLQLRNSMAAGSYDGSPLRYAFDAAFAFDGSNPPASPRAHWGYLCKANPSQNSSPTSTLVGHSHSPPPLSPPLSPSGSPPMSPDSPTSWPGSATYSMSPRYQKTSTAGNGISSLQVHLSPASLASLTAGYQNSAAAAHRRQAEMMASYPSMADVHGQSSSPKAIGDLISSLQNMEVGSAPLWLQQQQPPNRVSQMTVGLSSPRAASNLRHCSLSLPSTPTRSRWETHVDQWDAELGADGFQRVESGRDLRAKIYARLSKDSILQDTGSNNNSNGDSPDLGWVNELVM